jgi:hypothetical protein
MRKTPLVAFSLLFLLGALGIVLGFPPGNDAALAADHPVTIMGAGDIAEAGTSTQANAKATGDLIRAANPSAVFALGDNAYPDGSASDYATKYDTTWGSFKAKTHPTPGNHEYHSTTPSGYLGYFGTANVTNTQNGGVYYAWNVGNGWRAYSLNSQISMSAGSTQEQWLKADLAAHPNMHYLAYLHYPRYNSGTIHGQTTSVCPLWNDLMAKGADLMLAGHDHSYERWSKMDCNGAASSAGIREFKVGSGGNQLYPFGAQPATLQKRNNTDYGVLKLVLHENSYDWSFLASGRGWNGSTSVSTTNKGAVLDSGTQATNRTTTSTTTSPSPTSTTTAPTSTAPTTTAPTSTAPTTTAPTTAPTTAAPTTAAPTTAAPTTTAPTTAPPVPAGGTLHYVANEGGAYSTTTGLGYTLHDTGLSASTINALPTGTRAMVWAENGKCPTSLTSAFTSFVVAQKSNPKLYGYFLVDEPSSTSASCAAGIRAMADYIHANAPGKKAFIELTDYPGTYAAYAPSKTHADLVGLDPYPCRNDATACDFEGIGKEVSAMVAAGVPRASIVPTFQLFGDSTWRAPTKSELQGILAEWQEYVPQPAVDYSYSWGCQSGSLSTCLSTRTDWKDVMRAYLTGAPATSPTAAP